MRIIRLTLAFVLLNVFAVHSQHDVKPDETKKEITDDEKETLENPQAFKIFTAKGKAISYKKMIKGVRDADMLFFGELHNNAISHWLQLELTRDLYAQRAEELVLGAEMFESDNQVIMNEYFLGYISQKSFESEMRNWPNYDTDYKPLIEFAKENGLRFAATNVPRRYASMVSREGIEKLSDLPDHSKIYFAPLPIRVDMSVGCYEEMLKMSGGNEFFPQAQMLKDATMAYFTLNNWNEGELFLHFNGSFHSDKKEGIIYYIRLEKPDLNIINITTVEQDDIKKMHKEHEGKADYIIVVPSRVTKTY